MAANTEISRLDTIATAELNALLALDTTKLSALAKNATALNKLAKKDTALEALAENADALLALLETDGGDEGGETTQG